MKKYFYEITINHKIYAISGITYLLAKTYKESRSIALSYKEMLMVLLPDNMTVRMTYLGMEDNDE